MLFSPPSRSALFLLIICVSPSLYAFNLENLEALLSSGPGMGADPFGGMDFNFDANPFAPGFDDLNAMFGAPAAEKKEKKATKEVSEKGLSKVELFKKNNENKVLSKQREDAFYFYMDQVLAALATLSNHVDSFDLGIALQERLRNDEKTVLPSKLIEKLSKVYDSPAYRHTFFLKDFEKLRKDLFNLIGALEKLNKDFTRARKTADPDTIQKTSSHKSIEKVLIKTVQETFPPLIKDLDSLFVHKDAVETIQNTKKELEERSKQVESRSSRRDGGGFRDYGYSGGYDSYGSGYGGWGDSYSQHGGFSKFGSNYWNDADNFYGGYSSYGSGSYGGGYDNYGWTGSSKKSSSSSRSSTGSSAQSDSSSVLWTKSPSKGSSKKSGLDALLDSADFDEKESPKRSAGVPRISIDGVEQALLSPEEAVNSLASFVQKYIIKTMVPVEPEPSTEGEKAIDSDPQSPKEPEMKEVIEYRPQDFLRDPKIAITLISIDMLYQTGFFDRRIEMRAKAHKALTALLPIFSRAAKVREKEGSGFIEQKKAIRTLMRSLSTYEKSLSVSFVEQLKTVELDIMQEIEAILARYTKDSTKFDLQDLEKLTVLSAQLLGQPTSYSYAEKALGEEETETKLKDHKQRVVAIQEKISAIAENSEEGLKALGMLLGATTPLISQGKTIQEAINEALQQEVFVKNRYIAARRTELTTFNLEDLTAWGKELALLGELLDHWEAEKTFLTDAATSPSYDEVKMGASLVGPERAPIMPSFSDAEIEELKASGLPPQLISLVLSQKASEPTSISTPAIAAK